MRSSAISFRCLPSLPPHEEPFDTSRQHNESPDSSAKPDGIPRLGNLARGGVLYPMSHLPTKLGALNDHPSIDIDSHANLVEEFDLYSALMARLGDKRKLQSGDQTPPPLESLATSLSNLNTSAHDASERSSGGESLPTDKDRLSAMEIGGLQVLRRTKHLPGETTSAGNDFSLLCQFSPELWNSLPPKCTISETDCTRPQSTPLEDGLSVVEDDVEDDMRIRCKRQRTHKQDSITLG